MSAQKNPPFDPTPYKKAILEIKSVERRMIKEIREEAEKQDGQKEKLNFPQDASQQSS